MGAGSVAVLGPGAIGGMLAALLWRAGAQVTCVASEKTAAAMTRDGITFRSVSLGSFVARPAVVAQLNKPVDLLIVATKAPALMGAIGRLGEVPQDAVVVPLLNGIEHIARLRAVLGTGVAAATIGQVEAKRITPIEILHTTKSARIEMANESGFDRERLLAAGDVLRASGIDVVVRTREAEVVWGKLVRLNAIALTTAAYNRPIGEIRGDPVLREELKQIVAEGAAVATADGLETDPAEVMDQIDTLPPTLGTSLQRDVVARRESELDAIAGGIVRTAERHGLRCPTIEQFIDAIEGVLASSPNLLGSAHG